MNMLKLTEKYMVSNNHTSSITHNYIYVKLSAVYIYAHLLLLTEDPFYQSGGVGGAGIIGKN